MERHSPQVGALDTRAANSPGSCIESIHRPPMPVHGETTQSATEWQVKPGLSGLPG